MRIKDLHPHQVSTQPLRRSRNNLQFFHLQDTTNNLSSILDVAVSGPSHRRMTQNLQVSQTLIKDNWSIPMHRIAAVIITVLALTGSHVLAPSAAFAQGPSMKGGSAVDRCIAKCKQQGTWKICDKWCEDRLSRYGR